MTAVIPRLNCPAHTHDMSVHIGGHSMKTKWAAFATVIILSFAVLGWAGVRIYQMAPPIPNEVRITAGDLVLTGADIETGQNVWQSMGGMEQGSIWGHGSYVAPDWSADWLHREAATLRDSIAGTDPKNGFNALPEPDQARFGSILKREMRTNSYDPR